MIEFIIGVDAGATKIAGCIQNVTTQQRWHKIITTRSITSDITVACNNIKQLVQQLLTAAQTKPNNCILVCGSAGISNPVIKHKLRKTLDMGFYKCSVTTDARASLYGAGNGESIIVVAIGTGTVAMRLNPKGEEKQFSGWGFKVGDLGSGADIGRELIRYAISNFDADEPQYDEITQQTFAIIGQEKTAILRWINQATSTEFAALVPIVCNFISGQQNHMSSKNISLDSSALIAEKIIKNAALEIEKLIYSAQNNQHYPVILTGGLAQIIYPYISTKIQDSIKPAIGDAVDGALFLAKKQLPDYRDFHHE